MVASGRDRGETPLPDQDFYLKTSDKPHSIDFFSNCHLIQNSVTRSLDLIIVLVPTLSGMLPWQRTNLLSIAINWY